MQQVVERSPNHSGARKVLVDLLETASEYERVEPHLRTLIKSAPNDPFLRLDLARALHVQGKTDEARTAMDEFSDAWDGTNNKSVWQYLRSKGLGRYVSSIAPPKTPRSADSIDPADTNEVRQDEGGPTVEAAANTEDAR